MKTASPADCVMANFECKIARKTSIVPIAFISQAAPFSYAHMCNHNMFEGWIVLPVQEQKAVCLSIIF